MAVHPLRPATRRRLGRPLPHQQADRPRAHPTPKKLSTTASKPSSYPVLDPVSQAYPEVQGRSPTCYSPVRHSSTPASRSLSVRLACVKHAASVHPEPGSNSPQNVSTKPVKQAVKSPKPNQKQTKPTPPPPQQQQQHQTWQKIQKLQRFNNQPPPDREKTGVSKKREKINQPAHTKPNSSMIHQWIQPHHHRHTPKQTQRMQNTVHTRQANNPRNKSTLAHYRVLKQHQHTHQPEPHSPSRSSGAEEQVTHPVNRSQTQVQPPFTKRQPYQLHSFPLTGNNRSEATDGYITTNHQPTQTPRQMRIFRLGVRE